MTLSSSATNGGCSMKLAVAVVVVVVIATISLNSSHAFGQDILRRLQEPQASQQTASGPALSSELAAQLANLQLPPQLASLTPQQLHQLAQLRELQIQHQQQQAAAKALAAEQQAGGGAGAPPPVASHPTAQPESSSANSQIPQPSSAPASSTTHQPSGEQAANAARVLEELDSAYKELGGELEGSPNQNQAEGNQAAASGTETAGAASPAVPTFEVNWNKCPQLEPSDAEKAKKTQVITKCLQSAPIPTNLTRENVENHREQIATCALKMEGWFDDSGSYKYDKAEAEIRSKKLESQIENQVLKFHVACKNEASNKFPRDQNKLIEQVQFYQACMDYYISIVCEIEVSVDQ